jgi:DNA repair exonuclease SbcCD nuclease subunit
MKLVVFSDGHIGEYSEGHIDQKTGFNSRLLDTLNVWDWVRELALQKKADAVIFGGDRFKPHRPPAWMRDLADERLNRFRRDNVRIACLLGNHDLYDKTGQWHSYNGVQIWNDDDKIVVFDKPGVLDFNGLLLHFLPYGYTQFEYDLSPHDINVLFFHDSVIGHSRDGKYTATTGIVRETIDRSELSYVLGGHIHLRQELKFENVPAWHIGTPLERVQDGDQGAKGALIVDVESSIAVEFVESPFPKIINVVKTWAGDIEEMLQIEKNVVGNVVFMVVEHNGQAPVSVRRELEKRLRAMGAASAKVRMQAKATTPLNVNAKINKRIPIGKQLLSYVQQVDNDPELLEYLKEIERRIDTI